MEIDLYCKTCRNAKDHKQQDNEICWSCVAMGGAGNYKESITKADRIRAMTDEELADMFESWIQDCGCNNVPCKGPCEENIKKYGDKSCLECWLDWLKQEATDDP